MRHRRAGVRRARDRLRATKTADRRSRLKTSSPYTDKTGESDVSKRRADGRRPRAARTSFPSPRWSCRPYVDSMHDRCPSERPHALVRSYLARLSLLATISLAACGGGGSSPLASPTVAPTTTPVSPSPTSSATPTPAPSTAPTSTPTAAPTAMPTPTPGPVVAAPTTLRFSNFAPQSVAVSEIRYSGSFATSTRDCGNVATISPASGTQFSVTPSGAGACSFEFSDPSGNLGSVSIYVTTANVVVQSHASE